jgi:Sec-independent protein translocase protein TatA
MFGISLYELLVIFIIGIIVCKPKDIVEIFVFIAKALKEIKLYFNKVENEINQANVFSQINDYIVLDKQDDSKSSQIQQEDVLSKPK